MKRLMVLAVALLLAVTAMKGMEPAASQITDQSEPPLLSAREALIRDAKWYAGNFNVTLDEALGRLELQDDVGKLQAELEDNESETFAGLYTPHEPDYRVVVLSTEGADENIRRYVEGEPLDALVEVRMVEANLNELEAAQAEAMLIFEHQSITVESDINVVENQVEVYVTEDDRVRNFKAVRIAETALPEYVEVITVDRLSVPVASFYGGLAVNPCTSGFVIRHRSGAEGMVTAGHCIPNPKPGSLRYGGKVMPFQKQSLRGSHDVQWHKTPNYDDRAFFNDRDGRGGYRGVHRTLGRKHQYKGRIVCKSGITTGYTCGRVVGRDYAPSYVNSPNGTFMRATPGVGGGDSGGPVFNGNTALGLVSGRAGSTGDLLYMAINYVHESDLGISHVQKAR